MTISNHRHLAKQEEAVAGDRLNQMTHLKSLHHLENHYQQPFWGDGDDDDDDDFDEQYIYIYM